MQVGQPDEERRHDTGSAGSGRARSRSGALSSAARSGLCTAQFFGTASKKTKITTTSKTAPTSTPRPPRRCSATTPTRVAETSWQIEHQQQDGVEELGRVLDQPGQLARPAPLLVDQRLGLDPVHAHQAGLGQGQHARGGQQDDDDDDEDDVLGVEARRRRSTLGPGRPVEAGEQLLLERLHPLGLGVVLVVHAEQVQEPVHDQQRHLVLEATPRARPRCGPPRPGRSRRRRAASARPPRATTPGPLPPRSGERPVGPGSSSMGKDRTSVGPLLPRNCSLQRGDGILVDEEERHLGLALDPACRQHLAGQLGPAGHVDRMVLLLIGGEDVDGHCVDPARPSATS